jgi:hypothetical protein
VQPEKIHLEKVHIHKIIIEKMRDQKISVENAHADLYYGKDLGKSTRFKGSLRVAWHTM